MPLTILPEEKLNSVHPAVLSSMIPAILESAAEGCKRAELLYTYQDLPAFKAELEDCIVALQNVKNFYNKVMEP